MNSHLPRPEKSRLLTVAMVAMAAKIDAGAAECQHDAARGPLENPRMKLRSRDSMSPMKNVKPSSTSTPRPLSFVFSMANMKPNAIARNAMKLMAGLVAAKSENPVVTPIQAPSTVGTIDSASSQ